MKIILILQNKPIFDIIIEDDFFNHNIIDRETLSFFYLKKILDNFSKRLDKKFSLILFSIKVFNETLKYYEEREDYEACSLIKRFQDIIIDIDGRNKGFKELINKNYTTTPLQ